MLAFYVAILDTEEQKDKFTEIYTTYYGMMYQVARAITHDDKLAEDALHVVGHEQHERDERRRHEQGRRAHPRGQRQTARLLPAHGHTESHHRLHAQVGSPKCVIL